MTAFWKCIIQSRSVCRSPRRQSPIQHFGRSKEPKSSRRISHQECGHPSGSSEWKLRGRTDALFLIWHVLPCSSRCRVCLSVSRKCWCRVILHHAIWLFCIYIVPMEKSPIYSHNTIRLFCIKWKLNRKDINYDYIKSNRSWCDYFLWNRLPDEADYGLYTEIQ